MFAVSGTAYCSQNKLNNTKFWGLQDKTPRGGHQWHI